MKQAPKIAKFSSFSILIVFFLCCSVGLALTPFLSIQLFPSISYASVTVSSTMPNASPQLTEMELTSPIESALGRLTGVKKIFSTSGFGNSSINVELDKWTKPELFRFEARAILRQLFPKMPKGATYPEISLNQPEENKTFGNSIMGYTVYGTGSPDEIARVVQHAIKPAIAKIKGIYKFEISGITNTQLSISEDPEKMRAANITHNELGGIIGYGASAHDLGLVSITNERVNIAIAASISKQDDLANYSVSNNNGRVFTLKDIARVTREDVPKSSFYRINGKNVITINFYPESHVNVIRLAREIKTALSLAEVKLPKEFRLALSYDNTEHIKEELNKIYLRTTLSILILLTFVLLITRQLRYIAIIICSLTANVLISFIFYYLFKLEIHLYSLAGITISIGLIIDNVIVIVEDITHTGRNRIFAAILASTLTALGALTVVFLLDEEHKINLLDFALTIIINLLVSLPVAYFLIPAMLDKFPVVIRSSKSSLKRRRLLVRFSRFYEVQIRLMLRFRLLFLFLFILLFGLPFFLLPEQIKSDGYWAKKYNAVFGNDYYNKKLRPSVNKYTGGTLLLYINKQRQQSFNPVVKEGPVYLNVNISMPVGATVFQMNNICLEFESFLSLFHKEVDVFTANISNANHAEINISFKKQFEKNFPYQLKQLLEDKAILSGAADFSVSGVGFGFNNAIDLDGYDSAIALKGYNFEELQRLALRLKDSISANPRVHEVLITTSSRAEHKPYQEYVVNVTRPQYLNLYNINRGAIGGSLQNYQERKNTVGNLREGNYNLSLELASNKLNPPGIWETLNAPMQINDSSMIRVKRISDIKRVKLGESIVKQDQTYILYVYYQFLGSAELNELFKAKTILQNEKTLPFGYAMSGNKNNWWQNETDNYLWFIPLVLVIIYVICAILLESFSQPFAVIIMIPFSFVGVFLIFNYFNLQFDQGGYASLLMLAGLVTNSALYIINDLNYLTKKSKGHYRTGVKIYIKSFNAKAMPIIVTTASAILSLLPFMINGEDKGFWFTLSAGTIGGLLFSLVGAFILLPLCLLKRSRRITPGIINITKA